MPSHVDQDGLPWCRIPHVEAEITELRYAHRAFPPAKLADPTSSRAATRDRSTRAVSRSIQIDFPIRNSSVRFSYPSPGGVQGLQFVGEAL